ncbi:hypothetical protein FJN17_30490 [Bradyrhizobium symbiodeficiens]|uniref:Uncharacterized protein n=1 Tax=Bradyrhizobium symbiodeficiens TaxID=1404367 RepID=A0ABX5WE91_9BRAD|nr:hypothetical protein [Bradyrhizobium symbiodeficiens]QDF41562.1 hypothetical protein FJN17_30490 [Bradyrhizobium symbiodeficiens]
MPVGEYTSPDGQLRLLVICPDGDWTLGFDGFPWHTHGSILASLSGKDEEAAIDNFVADLTSGKSVIAMKRIGGSLADVWVTDDPAEDVSDTKKYGLGDETMEFRLWDESVVKV